MTLYCFQNKENFKSWQDHIAIASDSLPSKESYFFLTTDTQQLKSTKKRWPQAICLGIYEMNDHRDAVDGWLSLSWSYTQIEKILQKLKAKEQEKTQLQVFLKDLITQEQDLENRKNQLETEFRAQKTHKQQTASNIKRLDHFLEALEKCRSLEEFLLILTKELKKQDPSLELFLWLEQPEKNAQLFWLERKKLKSTWTTNCEDKKQMHTALAQTLGRPDRKVYFEPIKILEMEGYFVFEYDKKQSNEKELNKVFQQFSGIILPILEHFVLTQKSALMAAEWQAVFDCLDDGLALFDSENKIITTNRKYQVLDDVRKKNLKKTIYPVSTHTRLEVYQDQERVLELKAQVAQKEKMTQLGKLATDLAHELNNPLTGIKALCQLMIDDNSLLEQQREDLKEILMAVDRSHEIIRNLLVFAAEEVLPTEIVSLKDLLNSTIRLLKVALHEHSLEIQMPTTECLVRAQPQLLQQVLFNLLINACQAMGKKGSLKVWIEKKNKQIYLYVKDSGPGISAEALKKVFEPFYTTKSKSEGTGLGLSLSRDIVRRFDGDIGVESTEGDGATFWFYLKEAIL